jgi:hypothetical protein
MARLVLGPVLRHVGERDATVWVETDEPCTVEVERAEAVASARTFTVARHHFALVVLRDLEPGSAEPYTVRLAGDVVWPARGSAMPPSIIRTVDPARRIRILFGSCRSPHTVEVRDPTGSGEDVLVAYARQLATEPGSQPPDALLMLGDQVYADETSEENAKRFARRRDVSKPPYAQAADFQEYAALYHESWGEPNIRWLLSTVPSSMIFDDHDVIDDWNTSAAWRRSMRRTSWWRERIVAALSSYWVYQHLGNLSPDGLERDELYRQVRALDDAEGVLRAFALRADGEADGGPPVMWSYRRDFGRVRLLVIDSRAGRVLTEGNRGMVSEEEFAWIEAQVDDGGFDHLVVGSSVPWLLPRALHDLESFDESLAAGARGRTMAWLAERLRRAVDLEHWAAFRASFDRLARLFVRVGTGAEGIRPPASISVLSGDVHHTYASRATFPEPMRSEVYQLTCSPFHNSIPLPMRLVFLAAWSRWAQRAARSLARFSGVPAVPFEWETTAGPYFGNHLALLELDGRTAAFSLFKSATVDGAPRAEPVDDAARQLAPDLVRTEPVPVHVAA